MRKNRLYLVATALFACVISHPLYAQTFAVDTLLFNGDADVYVNLVILGDGYQEAELDQFASDAEDFMDYFFSEVPFSNYQNYFNVFMIKVPSNESGAAMDPANLIDNYFGSTFGYSGIDRLLVPTKNATIVNVLANSFPNYDQVFMLVNSSKYGGSGGWVATASTNTDSDEIAVHEIGHSFTGLADEYWAGAQYAAERINMTQETDLDVLRWKNWLGDFGIGHYPHEESPAWYRPHQSCKMRYLGYNLCSVCTEGTIEKIHALVSPLLNYSPFSENVTPATFPVQFDVEEIEPIPNTIKHTWMLNGMSAGSNLKSILIDVGDLVAGQNTLVVNLEDTTVMLRVDEHETIHLYSVMWTIENTATGNIEIGNPSGEYEIELFPNPASDFIYASFTSSGDADRRIDIYDIGGEMLQSVIPDRDGLILIPLNELKPGVYVFNFMAGETLISSRKIIK